MREQTVFGQISFARNIGDFQINTTCIICLNLGSAHFQVIRYLGVLKECNDDFKGYCGSCSDNRIGELNTSKAKLRGAKYQRDKTKTKLFF